MGTAMIVAEVEETLLALDQHDRRSIEVCAVSTRKTRMALSARLIDAAWYAKLPVHLMRSR